MINKIDLIKKNLNVIIRDFKNETEIEIKDLTFESFLEKENKPIKLYSEFLDDKIGILSNNFKKVFVDFSITFHEENILLIKCIFSYSHKNGGFNRISILDEYENELILKYNIENEKISLFKNKIEDGTLKIVISHTDTQKDSIFIERKYEEWRMLDIISNECHIKQIYMYEMENGNWESRNIEYFKK